jgi:hypothetical protein
MMSTLTRRQPCSQRCDETRRAELLLTGVALILVTSKPWDPTLVPVPWGV